MEFLQALKNRRSIYNLGTNVNLSNEEITSIISDCLKYSPSAFTILQQMLSSPLVKNINRFGKSLQIF